MSEYQIEMLWRCTSCSARNRGRELVCASCGSPKDGSETYEMPSDISEANAVRDEKLIAVAKGGANWSCVYCGSDVRNRDGSCGRCGAGREQKAAVDPEEKRQARIERRIVRKKQRRVWMIAGAAAAALLVLIVLVARKPRRPPPPAFIDYDAVVTSRSWQRTIVVEKHQLWPFEGFDVPAEATQVKDLDQRLHHYETVPDGYDTQTWTEQVVDGYDTQSYTTTEACGQTCTPRPQNCSPVCTPNKNGFATCKNVCTGGGQSCVTKTCTVNKTKQVPRYKSVTKSKQVPRFRKEPRYAMYHSWQAMAWREIRRIKKDGVDDPAWPTDQEIALDKDERTAKLESYVVNLAYDGKQLVYVPTADTFATFALNSKHRVRVHSYGTTEVLAP